MRRTVFHTIAVCIAFFLITAVSPAQAEDAPDGASQESPAVLISQSAQPGPLFLIGAFFEAVHRAVVITVDDAIIRLGHARDLINRSRSRSTFNPSVPNRR